MVTWQVHGTAATCIWSSNPKCNGVVVWDYRVLQEKGNGGDKIRIIKKGMQGMKCENKEWRSVHMQCTRHGSEWTSEGKGKEREREREGNGRRNHTTRQYHWRGGQNAKLTFANKVTYTCGVHPRSFCFMCSAEGPTAWPQASKVTTWAWRLTRYTKVPLSGHLLLLGLQ